MPVGWKSATVQFLRKPAKSSYNETKAYRPISLSSSLGKVLEKIITWRLYGFAEVNKILDNDQEGFRRFHNTTQALLRFTQDIYSGFNATENTLAVFIDFEKAYDSVWREGLMVKLHEKGIRGRVWKWILDYLSNRNARCTIQEFKGDVFQTDTGLPQGSVIAPLLFSIFVSDLFEQISSNRVKFADDSTIWRTGSDLGSMLTNIQDDLDKILVWTKKWRMKINAEKTEVCCFTKDSNVLTTAQNINLTINGGIIPYNANPRLLGVFLDEHMTFSRHISEVERRGMRTLSLLQQVKLVEGINTTRLLQLYKSILRPQLEYAAPVWQIANCETLEKVQRKGLAMCLGVAGTAGGASVEVETGVLPLDLRREELSIKRGRLHNWQNQLLKI